MKHCSIPAESRLSYPANQVVPASSDDSPDFNGTTTDSVTITETALIVDQKTSAPADAPPDLPPANTTITALDGDLVNATIPASRRGLSSEVPIARRTNSNYEMVFNGTGTALSDRDGSIEGTAYLTYSLVSNATYDVEDCLALCDRVSGCGKFEHSPGDYLSLQLTYRRFFF